ncbi:hypothetical protein H632_c4048p1 [Helicosporidium sp. ATCC 50920]|nr:hypothetical protein H632_c4048p1 [Helicosporidium sp. ATCC 50920]|eukprot:KDD71989.1 hypothetical protein H632_c4048p1 [Helicosporidium sp. ATCC 50920]
MLQESRWRCQNGLDLCPSGYSNPYFSLTFRQELPASDSAKGCVSVFEAPKQARHLALLLQLPAAPGWPSRLHAALSSLLRLLSSAVVVGLAVEEHAADPDCVGVLGLVHDARSHEDDWEVDVAAVVAKWWDAACREGF